MHIFAQACYVNLFFPNYFVFMFNVSRRPGPDVSNSTFGNRTQSDTNLSIGHGNGI